MEKKLQLDEIDLNHILEAIQFKLYHLKNNSWPTNAPVSREDVIATYEELEVRILDECGRDS